MSEKEPETVVEHVEEERQVWSRLERLLEEESENVNPDSLKRIQGHIQDILNRNVIPVDFTRKEEN